MGNPNLAGLAQPVPSMGGLPIGATMLMPQFGSIVDLADGSRWLYPGTLISADAYPLAQKLDHLAVHGGASTIALPTNTNSSKIAHDGNGTVLVSALNTLFRSTDYGQTWASVASYALSSNISDVIWAGNRFIIAGCNTTSFHAAHSTTGASGTWTQGTSVGGLSSAADTVRLAYNPSTGTVVAINEGSTNQSVWRCTANSSFSQVSSTQGNARTSLAYGNGYFVIWATSGSSNCAYSTDDGATWTYYTPPSSAQGYFIQHANGAFMADANSGAAVNVATVPTSQGAWTTRTMPAFSSSIAGTTRDSLQTDGLRFFLGIGDNRKAFIYSDDAGLTWRMRGVTTSGATNQWRVVPLGVGGPLIFLPPFSVNSSAIQRSRSLVQPEFVGYSYGIVTGPGSGGMNVPYAYVRIK